MRLREIIRTDMIHVINGNDPEAFAMESQISEPSWNYHVGIGSTYRGNMCFIHCIYKEINISG